MDCVQRPPSTVIKYRKFDTNYIFNTTFDNKYAKTCSCEYIHLWMKSKLTKKDVQILIKCVMKYIDVI